MKLLAALLSFAFVPTAYAQLPEMPNPSLAAMDSVGFLVGDWKGEGWISRGPNQRHTFIQTERIRPLLHGDVLLIEGRGLAAEDTTRVIHDAVAFIGYDAKANRYTMRSFLPGGRGTNADAKRVGDALVWSPASGGIRYTIRLNEQGQWHEVGEIEKDGTWYPLLEMTLNRTDSKATGAKP